MRRNEFRPRAYERNGLAVALETRLTEAPVIVDGPSNDPDPEKPAPPPQVPRKPDDPPPDPGQPKQAAPRARVKK